MPLAIPLTALRLLTGTGVGLGAELPLPELPDHLRRPPAPEERANEAGLEPLWRGEVSLDALEKQILEEAMRRAHGVQTSAATILGISRRTLQYRLENYGLGK